MADPTPETIDAPPETYANSGAYAMVAQACAMAVQDAVAYLRNTETIANAAIGAAIEIALNDPEDNESSKAIALAQSTVATALRNFEEVSTAAAKTLADFPRD